MTWGWEARGKLPFDKNATGTTGGGGRGGIEDAKQSKAWPRYEAEYLKRALQSERYKYDTDGLDDQQRGVYLDKVTNLYKEEADECLKGEFEQWLQGNHECNDPDHPCKEYVNADGKPVRRWVSRSKEAEDADGGSKVGQARAGWKHTPWGRASLTHLPGVRDYLRQPTERANAEDVKLQLLAEYGPQNVEQAWMYFKHWVKGRPVSDAVALPAYYKTPAYGARAEVGPQLPHRMYAYDPEPSDRQPEVYARDENAYNAAVALPGEKPVQTATDWEDANVKRVINFREKLEHEASFIEPHLAEAEIQEREDKAISKDVTSAAVEERKAYDERVKQSARKQELTAPIGVLPSLG